MIEPYASYGTIIACEDNDISNISSVYTNHSAAFQLGMNHLIEKGYKKLVIVREESYNRVVKSVLMCINSNCNL